MSSDSLNALTLDASGDELPLETNLSATLHAFRVRMQAKRKEQATEEEKQARIAQIRHTALLQAMTKIRKSLTEVVRIDLGERFSLSIESDDWHGWPRIIVSLCDTEVPKGDLPKLRIVSHDRNESGSIEIAAPKLPVERISVLKEAELKQLPYSLKRGVRAFLDTVAEVVLASSNDDQEPHVIALDKRDQLEETKARPSSLTTDDENLFSDDLREKEILEKLPEMNEVSTLGRGDL